MIHRLVDEDDGQTLVEYGLLLAVIALSIVLIIDEVVTMLFRCW